MVYKIRLGRENPCQFVKEEFKVDPDKWQKQALEAFVCQDRDRMRILLRACAGPGKSAALAWMGWIFLACYGSRGEHPKGAVTSITEDNLKDNLWAEFSKWQHRSRFLMSAFTWTKERIYANDHPETWFLSARTWSKSANAEEQGRTMSGLHSPYVLFLIDESGEIPLPILKSAEQALSNCQFGKIVQAGNPSSLDGMLYAASTSLSHLWYQIRITGDPDDPNRSTRINKEWAEEQIKLYGRDNPWVMAFILGEFPPASINALLGIEDIERAMHRNVPEDQYESAQKRLGIDAARFGDDPWVIFPRQGLMAFKPVEMRNPRSQEVAARVALAKSKWGSEMEFFDGTGGYAGGAVDCMIQAGYAPQEINFSGKATDNRYFNKRSEMWFLMAEWVKRGGSLPDLPILKRELTAPTYTFQNGKFKLEDKEQIKKRLGFSPNYGDALSLTFALPEMPMAVASIHPSFGDYRNKAKSEYDPFSDENVQ